MIVSATDLLHLALFIELKLEQVSPLVLFGEGVPPGPDPGPVRSSRGEGGGTTWSYLGGIPWSCPKHPPPPHPVDRKTNWKENIILPHTTCAGVKDYNKILELSAIKDFLLMIKLESLWGILCRFND